MMIMEKDGNPKIIIETMLDHIEQTFGRSKFGAGGNYFDTDSVGHSHGDDHSALLAKQSNGTLGFEGKPLA
jgi:hypothetical protein